MAEEHENDLNLGENERVGDYLHRIRKIRGLELENLAKSIRLGKNILEAIESNNWNYFPTEAYLRSYIVSLCDKLSLDKNVVLKQFSAEINSQFWITQTNIMSESDPEKDSPDAPSSNVPKAAIIIILVIIVILFFASKMLNGYSTEEDDFDMEEETTKTEEIEGLEENANAPDTSGVAVLDTVPLPTRAVEVPAAVVPGVDTLRFECIPSPTDSTCGVTVKGVDTKMGYFKKMTNKYLNREDTSQVTITVPLRTKLFVNNTKQDYGNFNTLLFYNGQIVNKINRELR
ncbi:MAG: helix-turn-helix domain-containing protein [Fibromonadaceae bacterium]|jgi:transcriptional regulator with XRE-family HTH domain|nr:helix-turn-helix domain-containing protein [Fibromonadaceae bacterium]